MGVILWISIFVCIRVLYEKIKWEKEKQHFIRQGQIDRERERKAREIQQKYPHAVSQMFSHSYLSRSDVDAVLAISELELAKRETFLKNSLLSKRCQELKLLCPHGYELFCKNYKGNDIKNEIVANADLIRKAEKCKQQYLFFDSWIKLQSSFSKTCKKLRPAKFGCFAYGIVEKGPDEWGNIKEYKLKICELFYRSYCLDFSLDYSEVPRKKRNAEMLDDLLSNKLEVGQEEYDKIFDFINNLSVHPVVVFANSGQGDTALLLNTFHFNYLQSLLDTHGIQYVNIGDTDKLLQLEPQNIVVVDLVAYNKDFHKNCKYILDTCKRYKPCLVYIALTKEYSSEEMLKVIASAKQDKDEKEKKRLYELSHTTKDDATAYSRLLNDCGIMYLYHFTHKKNIDSIKKSGGLFSWKYCEDHNIRIEYPGGDDKSRQLDISNGLEDYVRLSFCDDHPMKWRLIQEGYELVLLKIKIDVAWIKGTIFSDINAVDNKHRHGDTLDDLRMVNFDAVKQRFVPNTSPLFKQHQAEVLVRTFIPLEYIINIDSPNEL